MSEPAGRAHERHSSEYRLVAYNTATQSENRMHDDAVASTYGFKGGLVPGVDVYAYLCHLPAERWGRAWLERGTMQARFLAPVYDGAEVLVTADEDDQAGMALALTGPDGTVCATATATLPTHPPDTDDASLPTAPPQDRPATPDGLLPTAPAPQDRPPPTSDGLLPTAPAPAPQDRPPATPDVIAGLDVLASTDVGFDADRAHEYLDDVREGLPLFRDDRLAHPGWLLRQANFVLSATVRLGPWIHVESECRHLGTVGHGQRVSTRARVTSTYERKGHHFVELDVQWVADGATPVMRARHLAIYQPRRSA